MIAVSIRTDAFYGRFSALDNDVCAFCDWRVAFGNTVCAFLSGALSTPLSPALSPPRPPLYPLAAKDSGGKRNSLFAAPPSVPGGSRWPHAGAGIVGSQPLRQSAHDEDGDDQGSDDQREDGARDVPAQHPAEP